MRIGDRVAHANDGMLERIVRPHVFVDAGTQIPLDFEGQMLMNVSLARYQLEKVSDVLHNYLLKALNCRKLITVFGS